MKNYSLGEFEELVLLVVAGQDGEAYGVIIQECKYQRCPCYVKAAGG